MWDPKRLEGRADREREERDSEIVWAFAAGGIIGFLIGAGLTALAMTILR